MKVICCKTYMRCEQLGVEVLELDRDEVPYKIWHADRYMCAECGNTIVCDFGRQPQTPHGGEEQCEQFRKSAMRLLQDPAAVIVR